MTMRKVAKGKQLYRKYVDEPTMSDRTLLVSVEDLIASAFGPFENNTVNFKLVQTILHILARQLRLLEQEVEIKFDELDVDMDTGRFRSDYNDSEEESKDTESVRGGERRPERKERGHKGEKREKKERGEKGEKGEKKERDEKGEKGEKEQGEKREKGEKERGEIGGKGAKKEKERGEKGEKGEKERGEKGEKGAKGEKERGEKEEKGEKERGEKEEKGEKERGEKEVKGEIERGEKGEKGEKKERVDKGEKRHDKRGSKDMGTTTVLSGEDDGDEAEGRGGHARHRKRGKKGEDDVEEGEGTGGRHRGGRDKRDEVERDEAEGESGQRSGGRGKIGEVEEDEAEEESGQRRGGRGKRGKVEGDEAEREGGHRRGVRGKRGKVEGDEAEGEGGGRRGGRGRRGEAEDETEEGGGRGRRGEAEDETEEGGGRGRRGEAEDETEEGGGRGRRGEAEDKTEEGGGRHHAGRGKRGEIEGDEAEGGGQSRDRDDRGADRHGERKGERHGEKTGERRGERRGEYDVSEDRGGRRRDGREGSGTSITVSEATRRGDRKGGTGKVLVAERGPATHGSVTRVGSIEVVTASQFALLNDAVRRLEQLSGPLPIPALPDNEQLRKDLAKGRASLSDTMEAVQLNARVQAAEEGLSRMAGLLTQLAAAGALPPDFGSRIGDLMAALTTGHGASDLPFDLNALFGPGVGAGGGAKAGGGTGAGAGAELFAWDDYAEAGTDQADRSMKSVEPSTGRSDKTRGGPAPGSGPAPGEDVPPPYEAVHVTRNELQDLLAQMKAGLYKEIQSMTARANHSVDIASNTSRSVSDKLGTALAIDDRVSILYQQTADYAVQLNGFDTGLSTQMTSFQEQMTVIRNDLKTGLDMLKTANNNAETAAILDLTERYENLVVELDNTTHLHSNLKILQRHISDELKSLVECVEMLREQKADRDEVLDCLRDKADISRLAGLLYEKDFAQARFEIDQRIEQSYDKFYKQDEVWHNAMRDLTHTCDGKAELITLMGFQDKATQDLNAIQQKLHQLEISLGEPKAALLTRQMAAGAACGACLAPAVMSLVDATHGKPMALPTLRPSPLGAEDLCLGQVVLRPHDTRDHICHRWVGGSHTLVAGNIKREKAGPAQLQAIPTKKFEEYGIDGKLYMMEEELQPCAECNKFSTDEDGKVSPHCPTPTGGGDQV